MKTKYQYGKFEHAMLTNLGPIFYEENGFAERIVTYF